MSNPHWISNSCNGNERKRYSPFCVSRYRSKHGSGNVYVCGFSCICSEEISLKMQCDGGTNWLNNTWCAICLIKRNTFYSNVCSTAIKLARSRKCTHFDYIIDLGLEIRISKYIARFNLGNHIRRMTIF